jgi:hypothetical protein
VSALTRRLFARHPPAPEDERDGLRRGSMPRCPHGIPGICAQMTETGIAPAKLVYRNKVLSVAVGVFFLFGTGVFIGQAFTPGKGGVGLTVLSAITAAASAALTTRTLVAPTITAAHNGVRVRTLLRTFNYGWAEIERFQVVVRPVRTHNRKVLTITLSNGETKPFAELNGSPSRVGWVDEAALKLNSLAALEA